MGDRWLAPGGFALVIDYWLASNIPQSQTNASILR